jgi:hypothetical protein
VISSTGAVQDIDVGFVTPKVNKFGRDVDPLVDLVDAIEVDIFIVPIEHLAVHD